MPDFHFEFQAAQNASGIAAPIDHLVIAGWAGRNEDAIAHHIAELAAIGVPPPSATPLFYRTSVELITQASAISVLGPDTSGEAEPLIIAGANGAYWLGLGSDHTDRKAETIGVALSKQLCAKPVGREVWRLDDVAHRWDNLIIRAYATTHGERTLYQEATLAALRTPEDLLSRLPHKKLTRALLFGGTVPTRGGIHPAEKFEMELQDDVTGKVLRHGYSIDVLPVVS